MAGHEWEDWFEREELIGQISDIRVQNLQVERELVQKRTFTRWMNLHLEKCDPPIEVHDLFRDIQDGRILMALLEELSGCKLLHGYKKSTHRIFRLNNIAKVLSFLEERNVKLVSIDAVDVADGNSSIILGLIWNIILFFQIKELTGNIRSQYPSTSSLSSIPTSSDSDASHCSTPSDERQSVSTAMREHGRAIKKLLQWVQKRTRKYGVAVQDFGKSWTSGLAFLAVIKSIDSSLVDMRKALLRSARENLEDAFRIAHYSLGIPRLLEPEDVSINAPDEQSIMIYVSQFLEHFPGMEEPEESSQLIERSVSMGRLNFRDLDSDHMRNGAQRGRVKERSIMFQRDSVQPPPKIFISSVSEDRSAMSPPFRVVASRSWSSEDILADSPHMDDDSLRRVRDHKEPPGEVTSGTADEPPQLLDSHSPTGSSVPEFANTESLMGDSAISSPDSWMESEYGATPDKFCESRSDSSLCDSGTAWDVYRATPIEVTSVDEGYAPVSDTGLDDQSIDEGIYSLSSLESTKEKVRASAEEKQQNEEKVNEANAENSNQSQEAVPGLKEEMGEGSRQEDEVAADNKPPVGLGDEENLSQTDKADQPRPQPETEVPASERSDELTQQNSVKTDTDGESECLSKNSDLIEGSQHHEGLLNGQNEGPSKGHEVESESRRTEEKKEEIVDEKPAAESKASEESHPASSSETRHAGEDGAAKADPAPGVSIPLISISSEPDEQNEGETPHEPEGSEQAGQGNASQAEDAGREGANTDASSPQDLQGLVGDARSPAEVPSCLESENIQASEQVTDGGDERVDDSEARNSSGSVEVFAADEIKEVQQEAAAKEVAGDLFPKVPSVNAEQGIDSSAQPDRHQDEQRDVSPGGRTETTQREEAEPSGARPNGEIAGPGQAPAGSPGDAFRADFDRRSPTENLAGDLLEPMDLFYPDKEEAAFTEPPDNEMQSWPSVLSVSALQPAPASDPRPEDEQLGTPDDDLMNGGDLIKEQVIPESKRETDSTPEPSDASPSPGETADVLRSGDAPKDDGESPQQSPPPAGENAEPERFDFKIASGPEENQIPPVLRQRRGVRFAEAQDNKSVAASTARKTNNSDCDIWWSESWEPYLLLLLWLLLYCFWLLPQIDLKTLPSLLLNH